MLKPTAAQLDFLLRLSPQISAENGPGAPAREWYDRGEALTALCEFLYRENLVLPDCWSIKDAWLAARSDPFAFIDTREAEDCIRLLAFFERAERFNEGLVQTYACAGYLQAIIARLAALAS